VLVSESVRRTTSPDGVDFVALGRLELEGLTGPVELFEARRAITSAR
jgi:class 3 adenylate cyclase